VYKNKYARKSLTVHHIQRRLVEWGHRDAGSDKDGWYGDITKSAVAAFQKARGLEGAGDMNAATLTALFDGDENVRIVI
jgi:peptidoglycan hydrolase-like protein with peptidoglycan-binding domain